MVLKIAVVVLNVKLCLRGRRRMHTKITERMKRSVTYRSSWIFDGCSWCVSAQFPAYAVRLLKYSPHYDVSSLCAVGTGGYANSVNIAREKRCPQFSDWPSFYGFPTVSDKQRRRSRPTRSNKGHSPGFTIFTNSSPSFRFPAQIDPIRPTLFVWGMGGVETLFQTKIDGFWVGEYRLLESRLCSWFSKWTRLNSEGLASGQGWTVRMNTTTTVVSTSPLG